MENLDYYNKSMSRTLIDKMFFLPHVDATFFVDYGCGDGSLIEACNYFKPESIYIGYDNNRWQVDLARNRVGYLNDNIRIYNILDYTKSAIEQNKDKKSCLILSSVIHEVYSYQSEEEIEKFWDFVLNTGFDYIAIRDMFPVDHLWCVNDVEDNKEYADKLRQFEKVWGSIRNEYNYQHFLLKYYQTENWERELHENYLPLKYYQILEKFLKSKYNYDVLYENRYILPFLRKRIKKDFGFNLFTSTHYQLLLEKQ